MLLIGLVEFWIALLEHRHVGLRESYRGLAREMRPLGHVESSHLRIILEMDPERARLAQQPVPGLRARNSGLLGLVVQPGGRRPDEHDLAAATPDLLDSF